MITVKDHLSHISEGRRQELFPKMASMGIDVDIPQELKTMQLLTLESFRNTYPQQFIERAKDVFQDS